MKLKLLFIASASTLLFSSCGAIFGGSKYDANIIVENHPNATITYKGIIVGKGTAEVRVKRTEANKFSFNVSENGQEQTFNYTKRRFRGWSFTGSLLGPAVFYIPIGLIIDFGTGSLYKPDITEEGVSKFDYKRFNYNVKLPAAFDGNIKKTEQLDVVYLKAGNNYKGTIIEQIPNVSLKIQTEDLSIFDVKMEEISKITKEKI